MGCCTSKKSHCHTCDHYHNYTCSHLSRNKCPTCQHIHKKKGECGHTTSKLIRYQTITRREPIIESYYENETIEGHYETEQKTRSVQTEERHQIWVNSYAKSLCGSSDNGHYEYQSEWVTKQVPYSEQVWHPTHTKQVLKKRTTGYNSHEESIPLYEPTILCHCKIERLCGCKMKKTNSKELMVP
jgi:hypothetical protein